MKTTNRLNGWTGFALLTTTLLLLPIKTSANENDINVKAEAYHGVGDKIKVFVKSSIFIKQSTTLFSYGMVAYDLHCPHSNSSEKYHHSRDRNTSNFTGGEWEYIVEASQNTDSEAYRDGYPMPSEMQWLNTQPSTTTHSVCKVYYQGLAVFSAAQLAISTSDLLPLNATVTFPATSKRSEYKSMPIELYRTTTTSGGGGGSGECASRDCEGPTTDPTGTPLLIDLAQNGIHLGDAGVGVMFDIDNTDQTQYYQWLKPGGDEAFIVRDLNGNGLIDDGSELFGTGTTMVADSNVARAINTTAPNGFVALAQYDQPTLGGNDDGLITAQDALWHDLLLWHDHNANGLTEPGELIPLDSVGLTQLETIPKFNNRIDPAGNGLYLWAWASNENIAAHNQFKIIDVFFKPLK